jgi:hypothetical protein
LSLFGIMYKYAPKDAESDEEEEDDMCCSLISGQHVHEGGSGGAGASQPGAEGADAENPALSTHHTGTGTGIRGARSPTQSVDRPTVAGLSGWGLPPLYSEQHSQQRDEDGNIVSRHSSFASVRSDRSTASARKHSIAEVGIRVALG